MVGEYADRNRGEEMVGALHEMGLLIVNTRDTLTCDVMRGGKRFSSHVDITTCSADILDLVANGREV